jgi:hypothetical protein
MYQVENNDLIVAIREIYITLYLYWAEKHLVITNYEYKL